MAIDDRVTEWAQQQPEIRAVLLAGSRARTELPADEWADYDFECFVTALPIDPDSSQWAEAFGAIWTYLPTQHEDGTPHPLVVYAGGDKVDFTFDRVETLEQLVREQRLPDSQQRGYKILVDKDGLAARLPAPRNPEFVPPSEKEFRQLLDGFWFGAVYVAKQIRRRNLWVVKFRDWTMKTQLLRLLEWRFQSTWHDGHFLNLWTDEAASQALHKSFGRYDHVDSWDALINSMQLFQQIARQVARQYQFEYPFQLENEIFDYVMRLRRDDDLS